jgi:hypothetical protein
MGEKRYPSNTPVIPEPLFGIYRLENENEIENI